MEEQSVVVEATPTPVMEVDRGPLVNMTTEQRTEFRNTGKLPEPPKKSEEAAPSSEASKAETSPASEADKTQEKPKDQPKPKQTWEERVAQLESTIAKIKKGAGVKETDKAESSHAPQPKSQPATPQNYQEWRKEFKAGEWEAKYIADHPEVKDYAEVSAAMADYLDDVRGQFRSLAQQQQAQAREWNEKVAKAESRYENFGEIADAFAGEILSNAPPRVIEALRESDILPDVIYTIGRHEKDRAEFLKMAKEAPGKAVRYIALTESLIADELEGEKTAKPAEEPPVKPRTQAPKPPSEAGGRAATPPDALESAAKTGDFRGYKAERTRRDLARLKG